ncbi:MAG TPA: MBL fold metallo-hydrolase [Candidatus Dormibacteraeota bacterium]|nr:MBL fold metallo-hydrolase [Candidatus Dormibacteraeota bacterium]
MFDRALPPLLKAELSPEAEQRMGDLEMASWEPVWAVGEQVHSRVRAFSAGKLALFEGERPTGVSIPIVSYALQTGDLMMSIDSGLAPRWRDAAAHEFPDEGPAPGMRYRPVLDGPTFAEQLAAEGLRPTRAVCTHLHLDHAGGARELGIPVEAAAKEIAAAVTDESGGYPVADLEGLQFTPVVLDRGSVGPFPAYGVLAPGVLAISTPGHTPGSISVFACLGDTWAFICGDAAYPRADEPRSEAYLGMLRIRRALDEIGGTLVLAGHDTAALRACADGAWLGT